MISLHANYCILCNSTQKNFPNRCPINKTNEEKTAGSHGQGKALGKLQVDSSGTCNTGKKLERIRKLQYSEYEKSMTIKYL